MFKNMKKLVVFTGAGISAESGIQTFRDSDGLWEGHNVNDVATPEGWAKNPQLVMDFYNKRRAQLHNVLPNLAHEILVNLENDFDVSIITQNVDNLHEKAGSTDVLHLHGELLKVRSTKNYNYILNWHNDLTFSDFDDNGHQLRPHIVWFGEQVLELENAVNIVQKADILIVIGTSLQVYPAASLINFAQKDIPIYYIDLKPAAILNASIQLKVIAAKASKGLQIIKKELMTLK